MNFLERIQKTIEFIEDNLDEDIDLEDVAELARMCQIEYTRYFHAVTGYFVQDYIGKRRIDLSIEDILLGKKDIKDISEKYKFSSPEVFSMLFRNNTGFLPSEFKDQKSDYRFGAIDIPKKYYDVQKLELLERFPDIRLLKPIDRIRMAAYTVYGDEPENMACEAIVNYALEYNYVCKFKSFRIFGFNTPDSIKSDGTYGYTVAMTIDESHKIKDPSLEEIVLEDVQYVLVNTRVSMIRDALVKFKEWLRDSGYYHGKHQYMEEHILCTKWREKEALNDIEINLYLPVSKRKV